MNGPNPTTTLEDEHRVIEKVAAAIGHLAGRLEAGQAVEPDLLLEIADFMRAYADRLHHGKEEERLFPLLLERGVPPEGCPIGALTHEHVLGRSLVGQLVQAAGAYREGQPEAPAALLETLRALAELYPNHIWKEDFLLFPMSNKVLNDQDRQRLAAEFQAVDTALGQGLDRYEAFAAGLADRLKAGR